MLLIAEMQRPRSPFFMNVWNLADDDGTATAPLRGRSRHASGHIVYPFQALIENDDYFEDYGGFTDTRVRDLIVSRSLDNDGSYEAPTIDVTAVLGKCRKVVYKPRPTNSGRGKAEVDQNECPVCLEKFVAEDQLLLLPCNHRFHSNCIIPWIKTNHARCPCCRADILVGVKKDDDRVIPRPVSTRNYGSTNNGRSSGNSTIRNVSSTASWPRYSANSSDRFSASEALGGGAAAAVGRAEHDDDVMVILIEMEAALNRWGFLG